MTEFDPLKSDAYAKHLSHINKTNKVVTSEDIYNQKGALLVKSGQTLESNVTEKLLQHRLMKPLQDSVRIENAYNSEKLYHHIINWIKQHDDLTAVHERNQIDRPLKTMCNLYAKHHTLQQMLTVMSEQLPETFDKGCFCAWLSIGICQKLLLDPSETSAIFIASLCHDIGLLHIPFDIVLKKGKYEPHEWRAMQSHTVIGQLLTKSIPNLPKLVPRAILEHHENCQGTGYPAGRIEEKLLPAGQMIALCDTLYPLRFDGNQTRGSLKSLLPFLQINQTVHRYQNYQAIVELINKTNLVSIRRKSDAEMPDFCKNLLQQYTLMGHWARTINEIIRQLPNTTDEKPLVCAQKIYLHIIHIVKSSGLFNIGIKRWIEHVLSTQSADAYCEMEEIGMMYNEVLWQMQKIYRQLATYQAKAKQKGESSLDSYIETLSKLDKGLIPDTDLGDDFDVEKII